MRVYTLFLGFFMEEKRRIHKIENYEQFQKEIQGCQEEEKAF